MARQRNAARLLAEVGSFLPTAQDEFLDGLASQPGLAAKMVCAGFAALPMEEFAAVWETISNVEHNRTIAGLMQGSQVNMSRLAKIAHDLKEEAATRFAEGAASRNPPRRNEERDAEVVRIQKENPRLTRRQIAVRISENPAWAMMENDKPFSAGDVKSILTRARKRGELP